MIALLAMTCTFWLETCDKRKNRLLRHVVTRKDNGLFVFANPLCVKRSKDFRLLRRYASRSDS